MYTGHFSYIIKTKRYPWRMNKGRNKRTKAQNSSYFATHKDNTRNLFWLLQFRRSSSLWEPSVRCATQPCLWIDLVLSNPQFVIGCMGAGGRVWVKGEETTKQPWSSAFHTFVAHATTKKKTILTTWISVNANGFGSIKSTVMITYIQTHRLYMSPGLTSALRQWLARTSRKEIYEGNKWKDRAPIFTSTIWNMHIIFREKKEKTHMYNTHENAFNFKRNNCFRMIRYGHLVVMSAWYLFLLHRDHSKLMSATFFHVGGMCVRGPDESRRDFGD